MTREEKLFVICLTIGLSEKWTSMFCDENPELAKKALVEGWSNLPKEDVDNIYLWMETKAESM